MHAEPSISDAYEITMVHLRQRTGLDSSTIRRHVRAGNLVAGTPRRGCGRQVFWTIAMANRFLRRVGKAHLQFPKDFNRVD